MAVIPAIGRLAAKTRRRDKEEPRLEEFLEIANAALARGAENSLEAAKISNLDDRRIESGASSSGIENRENNADNRHTKEYKQYQ
jgi:hypothetical protein